MTAVPHSIGRAQSLKTAQTKMRKWGARHLPVLENGRLAGILSERDVYFVETIAGVDPATVKVEEAMTVDVYVVPPNASLLEVAEVMADHKYGCAVVMEGPLVVGIFTSVDGLRALVAVAGGSVQQA
jgi:acetoin utilization protein AcuB